MYLDFLGKTRIKSQENPGYTWEYRVDLKTVERLTLLSCLLGQLAVSLNFTGIEETSTRISRVASPRLWLIPLAAQFKPDCKKSQPKISCVNGELRASHWCSSALPSPASRFKLEGRRGQPSWDCCACGEPIAPCKHSKVMSSPAAWFKPAATGEVSPVGITVPAGSSSLPAGAALCCLVLLLGLNQAAGEAKSFQDCVGIFFLLALFGLICVYLVCVYCVYWSIGLVCVYGTRNVFGKPRSEYHTSVWICDYSGIPFFSWPNRPKQTTTKTVLKIGDPYSKYQTLAFVGKK